MEVQKGGVLTIADKDVSKLTVGERLQEFFHLKSRLRKQNKWRLKTASYTDWIFHIPMSQAADLFTLPSLSTRKAWS